MRTSTDVKPMSFPVITDKTAAIECTMSFCLYESDSGVFQYLKTYCHQHRYSPYDLASVKPYFLQDRYLREYCFSLLQVVGMTIIWLGSLIFSSLASGPKCTRSAAKNNKHK